MGGAGMDLWKWGILAVARIVDTPPDIWLKPFFFLLFVRPINGTAMKLFAPCYAYSLPLASANG
jgi:hypothetical protein